jgi:lysophospholipase L1-like esterase
MTGPAELIGDSISGGPDQTTGTATEEDRDDRDVTDASLDGQGGDATRSNSGLSLPVSVAVVGDSLTLSAVEELRPALTRLGLDVIAIDGVEDRRMVSRTSTVSSGSDAISVILENDSPDLWVIALGTNDVGAQQATQTIRGHMTAVLDLIPDGVPVVWVDLWIRDRHDQIVDVNDVIDSVIAARPGSAVVDWYSHGDDKSVITADGVHLTAAGQRVFAGSIAATIDTLFQ